MLDESPSRLDEPVTQVWLSDASTVKAGTLGNLARVGLIPKAGEQRPVDALVARVLVGLGAPRSTNRATRVGERTHVAMQRDKLAAQCVRRLFAEGRITPNLKIVALPHEVYAFDQDFEVLKWISWGHEHGNEVLVLPLGTWFSALTELVSKKEAVAIAA